jgi:hypothetical protein
MVEEEKQEEVELRVDENMMDDKESIRKRRGKKRKIMKRNRRFLS